MLENLLIEHCAPTLAGMKIANLFSYHYQSKTDVIGELEEVNHKLNERGVYVTVLWWRAASALVYVYRKSRLERQLESEEVIGLLSEYGYAGGTMEAYLEHLKERLICCDGFPHEIGVFLGYPLTDVIGFIHHKGENCKFCGLWKVYSNENETRKLFEKLQKCSRVYLRLFAEGRSITQMTVVA